MSFFIVFFLMVFGGLIYQFGLPFEHPLDSIFDDFFIQKMHRFFNPFIGAFWMDFGSLDPPKLSSRVRETLIFEKLQFSLRYRFYSILDPKSLPKSTPNPLKNRSKNQCNFALEKVPSFIEQWGPDGVPKGSQRLPKTLIWRSLGVSFSGLLIQAPPSR